MFMKLQSCGQQIWLQQREVAHINQLLCLLGKYNLSRNRPEKPLRNFNAVKEEWSKTT